MVKVTLQSAVLLILGIGMTGWGTVLWLGGRPPSDDWEGGFNQLLMLVLLLLGLLFIAAGATQMVGRRPR